MRDAGRRADVADEREHLVLLEAFRRAGRHYRLVAVVLRDELDLAPVHAALLVHRIEIRLDAVAHLDPELRGRAAEHGCLAETDMVEVTPGSAAPRQRRECEGGKDSLFHKCPYRATERKSGSRTSAATSSSRQRLPASSSYSARSHAGFGGERARLELHRIAQTKRAVHEQRRGAAEALAEHDKPRLLAAGAVGREEACEIDDAIEVAADVHAAEPGPGERHRRDGRDGDHFAGLGEIDEPALGADLQTQLRGAARAVGEPQPLGKLALVVAQGDLYAIQPSAEILARSSGPFTGFTQVARALLDAPGLIGLLGLLEQMMIGIFFVASSLESVRVAWKPLSPGITTSISTRSGRCSFALLTASAAFCAVVTW